MSILIFLAVLFVLILVHEWGHFIVAKKTGMRVDEFGIGFPPKLFGIKKGETEYTFNLFPIGGFVRIFGENSEGSKDSGDYEKSFVAKSKLAQSAVLVAGVIMNVILAWFLLVTVFMVGMPVNVDEENMTANSRLTILAVAPDSPADTAGLSAGVTINEVRAIDSDMTLESLTPTSFQQFTANVASGTLLINYNKGSTNHTATVTPEAGLVEGDEDRYVIGVHTALMEIEKLSFGTAITQATTRTYELLGLIVVGISNLIKESVMGKADFTDVAGPVGIVGMIGDMANFGFTSLLYFTAVISLNLAVINLLPFPALDGGRLLFVAIESITGRQIDPKWVLRLNATGFILLILLMIAITYNDILRLL